MKRYREYKIRYFDKFGIQRNYFAADLDESFFREWYDKLAVDPEENWHQSAATSIHLLVRHKDAPDWLRDIYANHSRYDRRQIAFLEGSPTYKYKNLERILSDRSTVVHELFFHSVMTDLQRGFSVQPEHLSKLLFMPPLTVPSLRTSFRQAIQEEYAALVHPDSTIRTLGKIFYNATPEQKQLLLNSIK